MGILGKNCRTLLSFALVFFQRHSTKLKDHESQSIENMEKVLFILAREEADLFPHFAPLRSSCCKMLTTNYFLFVLSLKSVLTSRG